MRTTPLLTVILLIGAFGAPAAQAQGKSDPAGHFAPPPIVEASALKSMPVLELAVFKDGHAFVLHESEMPTDAAGDVVLDTLPTPVLGTFWPYASDPQAKLKAVVAGRRPVKSAHPTASLRELIDANPGAAVSVTEVGGDVYDATLRGAATTEPVESAVTEAQAAAAPPRTDLVLLEVHGGVKALPLSRIQDITFRAAPETEREITEQRKLLTLQMDWGENTPDATARVGMVYLQRGVRWIPNYRVDIDGAGQAQVRLQATLVNDLVDLHDVTLHLVIGVPSFAVANLVDPIALQEAAAQVAQSFGPQQQARMQYSFSNAMMTQVAQREDNRPGGFAAPLADADPAGLQAGSRSEDLFIFTISHVSLRKGERMVVPVTEFTLTYEDVYTLELPFAPPPEVRGNMDNAQMAELARQMRAPKVMHCIRLKNDSAGPLTTAPAIVLRDGRLLAQSLMRYAATGAQVDLTLTPAVDVPTSKSETETQRKPDALQWNHETYGRVDLAGQVRLTNHRAETIHVIVTRYVLGAVDSAEQGGAASQANAFEDSRTWGDADVPYWWYWYNWPYWWHRFNGLGRIVWDFEMTAGQTVELNYAWHYFWR